MAVAEQIANTIYDAEKPAETEKKAKLDEGLLRREVHKKWPGDDKLTLKLIIMWHKDSHYRCRANWYGGDAACGSVEQSKFFHAIVGEKGDISILDKTNCERPVEQRK